MIKHVFLLFLKISENNFYLFFKNLFFILLYFKKLFLDNNGIVFLNYTVKQVL